MSSITPETSKGRKPSDNPQDICNILLTWKDQLIIAGRLRTPTDKIWQRIKTVNGISKSTKALYSFVKCNRFNILDLLLSSASSERKIETCSDDLEQNIRTEHTSDKSLRQKSSSLITTNRKRKKSILETPTSESEEIDKRKGRRVRDNTKKVFDILLANEERIIIGGKPRTPTDSVWEQIKQENDIDTNAKSLYTFVKCNRHNILDHMQSYSPPVESILEYSDDEYQDEDVENICNGEQVIKESSVIYQDIPMVHTTDQEMSFATIEEAEQFPEHFINIGLSPSNDDSAIITEQNTSYMFRNDFEYQEITEKGKKRERKPGDDPKKVFNILLAYKDRLFREGRPVNKDDSVWEQIKQDEGLASSADALRMFVEMNRYNIRDKMQACVIPESNVHDSGQEHDNTRISGHEMTSSVDETGEVVLEYSFGGPTIGLKNSKRIGKKPGDDPKKIFDILLANKDRILSEGRPVGQKDIVWEKIKQDEGLASSSKELYLFVEMNRYNIRDKMQACVPETNVQDSGQVHENICTSGHEMTSEITENEGEGLDNSIGGSATNSKEIDKMKPWKLGRKPKSDTKKIFDILLANKERLLIAGKPRPSKDRVWEQIKQENGISLQTRSLYILVKLNRQNILKRMRSHSPADCVEVVIENSDQSQDQYLENTWSNEQGMTQSCRIDKDIPLIHSADQKMSFSTNEDEGKLFKIGHIPDSDDNIMILPVTDQNISYKFEDDSEDDEDVFKLPGKRSCVNPRKIFDILLSYRHEIITDGKLRSPNDMVWTDIKRDECLSLSHRALYAFVRANMYNIYVLMRSLVESECEAGSSDECSDQELVFGVDGEGTTSNYSTRSRYKNEEISSEHNEITPHQQTESEGCDNNVERKPSDDPNNIFVTLLVNKHRLLNETKLRTPEDSIWENIKQEKGIVASSKALYKFVESNKYNILFLIMSTTMDNATCEDAVIEEVEPTCINYEDIRSFFSGYQPPQKSTIDLRRIAIQRRGKRLKNETKKIFDILLANKDRIIIAGKPRTPTDSVWEEIKREECLSQSTKALYTFVKTNKHDILSLMLSPVVSECDVGNNSSHPSENNSKSNNKLVNTELCSVDQDVNVNPRQELENTCNEDKVITVSYGFDLDGNVISGEDLKNRCNTEGVITVSYNIEQGNFGTPNVFGDGLSGL